jgi:3-oxoacyl-[acyl-carrier protein] reductase
MSLLNKTAIITGATRGIGLGIAEAFAKQGTRTILIGQNESRVRAVESRFQEEFSNGEHRGVILNISNKDDIENTLKVLYFLNIHLFICTNHILVEASIEGGKLDRLFG